MADRGVEWGAPRRDGTDVRGSYSDYLDHLAAMSEDGRRRRCAYLQLDPGQRVLDAGCGLGEVSRALAQIVAPNGRASGVDLNAEHLALARQRASGLGNVEYRHADITSLPFEDASFDAIYSERVFQHLRHPQTAMGELFRVLRPGGSIVVADADHLATVVDADDRELAERIQGISARLGSVNPAAGRRLRSQMVVAGFVQVQVEPEPLVITDRASWTTIEPTQVQDVLDTLVADGDLARERADAHLADLARRQNEDRFLAILPGYSVIGSKPTAPED